MVIKGDIDMFIKRGDSQGKDGKIISVIDEDDLTDAQRKAAEDLSKKTIKRGKTDSSEKLGS
jgi:inorganic pyrophosphatase